MYRLLFILLICGNLFAQTEDKNINKLDAKGLKQGPWVKYFPGSEFKRYEGQFKDDKPVGVFKYYYPTGELKSTLSHHTENKSTLNGFYENGALMCTGAYVDTIRDSTWTFYNIYGGKLSVDHYILGKRYGNCTKYHVNGRLLEEKFFERELEHGPFKQYFDNGNLSREGMYEWGSLEGKGVFYYPNGQVRFEGTYFHDTKHGIWKKYNIEGELIDEREYVKGVPEFRDSDLIKEDSTQYYRKDWLDIEDFIEEDYMAIPEDDKKKDKK